MRIPAAPAAASMPAAVLMLAAALAACGSSKDKAAPATTTLPAATSTSAAPTSAPTTSRPSAPTTGAARCDDTASGAGSGPGQTGDSRLPELSAIQMVSSTKGWMAGRDGVFATTDGQAWKRQFASDDALTAIDFVSATDGWAVGTTKLFGTTDGACWHALGEPAGLSLRSVHFTSATVGWGVAVPQGNAESGETATLTAGVLVTSTDGGKAWGKAAGSLSGVRSVCFFDASNGAVGASDGIHVSHDGGDTFTLTRPKGDALAFDVRCGKGVFWATVIGDGAAGSVGHAVERSTDGATWTPLLSGHLDESSTPVPASPTSYPGPSSVVSADDLQFVGYTPAADPDKAVIATSVTPTSASPSTPLPGMIEPLDTSWLSAQLGWVVGKNPDEPSAGRMFVTTDGGATWAKVAVPSPA